MSAPLDKLLEGLDHASVLQWRGPRRGNALLVVGEGADRALLKVYQPRRAAWREAFQALSHRVFERKRGVSPAARHATEHAALTLWREAGFDVPRILDRPRPPGVQAPYLWLELCEGRTLYATLADPAVSWEVKRDLLSAFGAELGQRLRMAHERREALLVHEHGTIKHVLVAPASAAGAAGAPRLVTFDLEGGYLPRAEIEPIAAAELKGHLRSIAQVANERTDEAFRAFAQGFGEADLLSLALAGGTGGGLSGRLRRAQDQWQRPLLGKTELVRRLAKLLQAP